MVAMLYELASRGERKAGARVGVHATWDPYFAEPSTSSESVLLLSEDASISSSISLRSAEDIARNGLLLSGRLSPLFCR